MATNVDVSFPAGYIVVVMFEAFAVVQFNEARRAGIVVLMDIAEEASEVLMLP
jgi:hypothetical protein